MKGKLLVFGTVLALVALLMAACAKPAPAPAPAPKPVTLAYYSGAPGGSWYPIAVASGTIWEKNIQGVTVSHTPGGGVANVLAVNGGDADVGVSTSVSVGDGLIGNLPFETKTPHLSALCSLYTSYLTVTVFKDSGIMTLEDLKGKRISPSIKGYTAEAVTKKMLAEVGLTYDDMAKVEFVADDDAADLMKDGHLDAYADLAGSVSEPLLQELGLLRPIWVLPCPDDVLERLQAKSPGLFRGIIPAGSYNGVDEDVPIVATALGLIVNPDLPEDLVYNMAKTLAENWASDMGPVSETLAKVNPEDLAKPMGVDFHPGALKYYKEQGWIK